MTKVGFTGTRHGMTQAQMLVVYDKLFSVYAVEFHHGKCRGADEEACLIADQLDIKTIAHPPLNDYMRSSVESDIELPPKGYLPRNRDIVDESDLVIAAPLEHEYVPKSGTWYTLTYAKKRGVPLIVIFPDGSVERHNFE